MKFRERYTFDSSKDFIGKGGFSRVYKAHDNIRKRYVALKFYKGNVSDKYDIISEINRMDDMVHPNLIRYYDANIIESVNAIGETEQIQVGIMEYANAGDLSGFFKVQRSPEIISSIIKGILKGLAYLHENGIAHRDLKPKNILLSKNKRGKLMAKIADFGISKRIDTDDATMSSQLMGSVEYMAPEQFAPAMFGLNQKLATNVDLWALGIIIYELYAQNLPFGSRTAGINYEQILNNILFNDLNIDYNRVPEPYRTILRKCLVKKAADRAKDAMELLDILEGNTNTTNTKGETKPVRGSQKPTKPQNEGTSTRILNDLKIPREGNDTRPTIDIDETKNVKPVRNQKPPKEETKKPKPQITKPKQEPIQKETPKKEEPNPPRRFSSKSAVHEINVGKNLFKLGNYEGSFKILDRHREYNVFDTEAKFYLGYMYYNGNCGGAYDEALGKKLMGEAKRENRSLVIDLMLKYVLNK
ncbi:MAG: serine/threonine-protein kinase [Chitinophagales bacterium]